MGQDHEFVPDDVVNKRDEPISDELCDYLIRLDQASREFPNSQDEIVLDEDAPQESSELRFCLDILNIARTQGGFEQFVTASELAPFADSLPPFIGRFKILKQLGFGGFGIVFLGVDPTGGRQVAIKIPRPEFLRSQEKLDRFAREVAAVVQLAHPNIVPILESDCLGIVPYIVMPYVDGKTLAEWRSSNSAVSAKIAAEILHPLALAVAHAHERGVLHRDVTPANVLLARNQQLVEGTMLPFVPMLTDFGLAKCAHPDEVHTRTGATIGTVGYMSPEQAEGRIRDITARTDVYGLGVILYELLSGKPPFCGDNEPQAIQKLLRDEPASLRGVRPKVPIDLELICLKCLEKNPANRYPSALALADDLRCFLNEEPISARAISTTSRILRWCRRRPVRATIVFATLLGLASITIISLWFNSRLTNQLAISEFHRREARRHEDEAKQLELETRQRAYLLDMQTAKVNRDQGNIPQMLKLLDRYQPTLGKPDIRDFTWWYLWREYHESSRVLGSHGQGVTTVAMSRDGRLAASGGFDCVIRLWSLPGGKLLGELHGHEDEKINSLAFSPTGERLASAGSDGTVRVWNTGSCKELFVKRDHESAVNCLAYSPNGDVIASGGEDQIVRLWQADDGTPAGVLSGHTIQIRCLAFHPSEPLLVTGDDDCTIRCWNFMEGSPDQRIKDGLIQLPQPDHIPRSIAFETDGNHIIAATAGNSLYRLSVKNNTFGDVATHTLHTQLTMHPYCVTGIEGGYCAVGLSDAEIRILHPSNLRYVVESLKCHFAAVKSIGTSVAGTSLVSGSQDGVIRYWPEVLARTQILPQPRHPFDTDLVRLQWQQNYMAVDSKQSEVSLYRMPERILERNFPKENADDFVLSSSGKSLLVDQRTGPVTLFHTDNIQSYWTRQLPAHTSDVSGDAKRDRLAIDDSDTLALVARNERLFVLSLGDASVIQECLHNRTVRFVAFLKKPENTLKAISICDQGLMRDWNPREGILENEFKLDRFKVSQVIISADQELIAVKAPDQRVRIFQLDTMQEIAVIGNTPQEPAGPVPLGFLEGSKILLLRKQGICFWSVSGQADLLQFYDWTSNLPQVAIDPTGTVVAVPKGNGIRFFDGSPSKNYGASFQNPIEQ